ncbi:MAG: hypothetical protein R3D61_12430 [Defluviimonas denitrificans]
MTRKSEGWSWDPTACGPWWRWQSPTRRPDLYDYEFAAKRGLYVKGVDHRLVLSGIAHAFGPADTSPLEIGPDAPGYAALSEWSGAVGDNGKVTVQTTGMAAILPREDIAPNA